ncbi:MAG TPA: PrsW family glutamic-type intramembrane protease [Pseudonocardia sp.]|jgi:RsiW-degrading membrane proteinase PrsW (M82 family)|nr:PrsW family glutamic-type intramembrane protease [Pseudonocardia sp.]
MSIPPGYPPPTTAPPPSSHRAYPHRIRRQRRVVLATVLGLVALGFCGLLVFGLVVQQVGTGATIVGTLCALLPVGPVVAAFLWLDRWEPEPPRLLLFAFLWGACFAALAALIVNTSVEAVAYLVLGPERSTVFGAVFVAPWVEEAMKGSFVLGLMLFRRREFDGILDGVVYAGIVAAGFAFSENILYLGKAYSEGAPAAVLVTFFMRGVISPFAHPLFTSMTGIGLGFAANVRSRFVKFLAPLLGYLAAVALHALWNGSASLGLNALVGVYALVMLPIFGFVVVIVLYQRRREQRVIAAELPTFAAAGWIAPSEAHLLESMAGRRGWLRAVKRRSGPAVAEMVADYQAAITELAVLRHRMARGSLGPHANEWHDELLQDVLYKRARAVGAPEALTAAWGRRTPPPGWTPPDQASHHRDGGPQASQQHSGPTQHGGPQHGGPQHGGPTQHGGLQQGGLQQGGLQQGGPQHGGPEPRGGQQPSHPQPTHPHGGGPWPGPPRQYRPPEASPGAGRPLPPGARPPLPPPPRPGEMPPAPGQPPGVPPPRQHPPG